MKKTAQKISIDRREALKIIGTGMFAAYITACTSPYKRAPLSAGNAAGNPNESLAELWKKISSVQRNIPSPAPLVFSGDQPQLPHEVLWDREAYFKQKNLSWPETREQVPLVIIGGGLSGLSTAYLLREYKPVVLEQAPVFGGNSRGESWQGIDYSIGAAYIMKPDPRSPLHAILKELGLLEKGRTKSGDDPVILNNQKIMGFWEGSSSETAKSQCKKIMDHCKHVYNEEKGFIYPDYPTENSRRLKKISALDRISFKKHMEKVVGETLHPHINAALEHFCWSSAGASSDAISAAAGLNFFASEFGGDEIMIFPGGNSAVTEALAERLYKADPSSLRPKSLVFDVQVKNNKVHVHYLNSEGQVKGIEADAAVMACPKFVVKKILNPIEPSRKKAIEKMQYNAYLVANLCLNKSVPADFYDLYMIGDGNTDSTQLMAAAMEQKVTDVVHAAYAKPHPDKAVLTLYRPLPYPGGRAMVYADTSYEQYRQEFEDQIQSEILPLLSLKKEDIAELRITRWGHPLPVAQVGFLSENQPQALRKPFRSRVFFVEQDNWALPAFETAVTEAYLTAPKIKKKLKRI